MTERPAEGHRNVPHTADIRIEAWAPTRERCLAQAVTALLDSFVDTAGAEPTGTAEFRVPPGRDPDLLVTVLDEVIYRLETEDLLPLHTEVRVDGDGLLVDWRLAGTGDVELVGAVPKAVALHDLRFGPDDEGWSCAVTLDV